MFYDSDKEDFEGFILPEKEKFEEWIMSGYGKDKDRAKYDTIQL